MAAELENASISGRAPSSAKALFETGWHGARLARASHSDLSELLSRFGQERHLAVGVRPCAWRAGGAASAASR